MVLRRPDELPEQSSAQRPARHNRTAPEHPIDDVLPGEARVLVAAQESLAGQRRGVRGLWPFLGPAFTGPGADATGDETPEGFLVDAGSTARSETVSSSRPWLVALRTQLIEAGVLVIDDGALRFTTDHPFPSPSSATSVVLGRHANGRTEWKDESGKTLKQIQSESVSAI